MLMSLGHEVVGILPFPLPARAGERETAARIAVGAEVCIIDPGKADLVELLDGLRILEGNGVPDSPERDIGEPEQNPNYINTRRCLSEQTSCRFVVLTAEEHRSAGSLRSLLEAKIQGVVSKQRSAAEIVEALTLVHRGGIYFDPDLVRRALIAGTARTRPYSATLLTQRELEVLSWLAHGAATGEMADAMGISAATVRSHIKAAMSKLGVSSRLQAAARAISFGLVDPPPGS